MSAAAKKKAKRKAKDKAKKEGGEEPPKPAAGKAPKVNARVRAMQELQELRKREEEETRIAEEERAQRVPHSCLVKLIMIRNYDSPIMRNVVLGLTPKISISVDVIALPLFACLVSSASSTLDSA